MAGGEQNISRRDLMKVSAATAGLTILGARGASAQMKRSLNIGLVGCGGRGNGAVRDCIGAGKVIGVDVRVTALADAYPYRIESTRNGLAKEGHDVPKDRCFVGFDGYKQLIASNIDVVLLTAPPIFRPLHFATAVEAGKHAFIEKPVAVDPVGCRKMMEMGEIAEKKGLSVVAGTQRRHEKGFIVTQKVVADGVIGRILGGAIYCCYKRLSETPRHPGWSDAEYMVRNWYNITEMSGDNIVETHVHFIDILNWFMRAHPIAAVGFGGRARLRTGNQYDFFSVDFEYANGVHIHSMCRQLNGCWDMVRQHLVGERGTTNCSGGVQNTKEKVQLPEVTVHKSPFVQEHVVLLDSIIKNQPVNGTRDVSEATLAAVMGRISAYTGQRVTWEEMMKSDLELTPRAADFETGNVTAPKEGVVPIPGKA